MTIHLLWSTLYLLLYVIPVLYGSGCQGKIGRKLLHDTLNNSDVVLTATVKNITIDVKDNQIKVGSRPFSRNLPVSVLLTAGS